MFVSINKKQAILSVDNEKMLYELIEQDDNFLIYKVSYSLDIVAAIDARVENLKITAKKYSQPVVVNDQGGSYSKTSLDLKLITARRDRKKTIRNKKKNILTEIYKSIKNEIDNDLFFQIRNFLDLGEKNPPTISGLVESGNSIKIFKNKTVLERVKNINDSNRNVPAIEINSNNSRNINPDQSFITDLILKDKVDPSAIADIEEDVTTYSRLLSGTRNAQKIISKSRNLSNLKKSLTAKSDQRQIEESKDIDEQQQLIAVRQNVFSNLYTFSHELKISKNEVEQGQFILSIELLDANGTTVDSTTQVIAVRNQQVFKNKVSSPPTLHATVSSNKVRLTLNSFDKNTKNIFFYKKEIKPHQPALLNNSYEYLGKVLFEPGLKTLTKEFTISSTAPTIYRAVAEDRNGELSPLFSSTVVSPSNKTEMHGCSIETMTLNDGIQITVNEFPKTAIAVGILRRDTTLREKKFSLIESDGEEIRLINNNFARNFVDTEVKKNHVYEYAARFYYKNGLEKQSGNSIIEFIPLERNKYFTTLATTEDVDNENNTADFSFDINTEISEDGLNFIKDLLESAGISEFFESDLQLERDKFNELLAYNVTRTNLTTGQIESFGNISANTFSDNEIGSSLGISPLTEGNTYRYTVRTLIRFPETLFESYRKPAVDRNGNEYTFSPFKFKHPIALNRGNIPTKDSLLSNYAKTQLDFGDVGDVATAIFSYKKQLPTILAAQVNQVNQNTLIISWKFTGDVNLIDHFLVMKKTISGKSIVSKVHAANEVLTFELFYNPTKDDIGESSFIILPIYNDYSRGEEVETNIFAYSG